MCDRRYTNSNVQILCITLCKQLTHQLVTFIWCTPSWNYAIFTASVSRLRLFCNRCHIVSQNFGSYGSHSVDFKMFGLFLRLITQWSHLQLFYHTLITFSRVPQGRCSNLPRLAKLKYTQTCLKWCGMVQNIFHLRDVLRCFSNTCKITILMSGKSYKLMCIL